jgi:hypothetical protein
MSPISSPAERTRQLLGESSLLVFSFDMDGEHAIAKW